jgi:uncharacterized protein (DUF488 family)
MYYRRKVILSLLESFNGELDRISFQKLLFLFSNKQKQPSFNFVPYHMGCFSFQSYADLRTMIKYGQISETAHSWIKTAKEKYTSQLNADDQFLIAQIAEQFGGYTSDDLIEHTYKCYPYYAFKSTIAKQFLSDQEQEIVKNTVKHRQDTVLFTIGYEGINLETYLNKLIVNDIKLLCDVRRNSLSMKYGFSKSQLQRACQSLGIAYVHVPELGIASDKRQNLKNQKDYDRLFTVYSKTTLKAETQAIVEVLELLKKYERIALTCFEANQCQCHRGTLACAIQNMPQFSYTVQHI